MSCNSRPAVVTDSAGLCRVLALLLAASWLGAAAGQSNSLLHRGGGGASGPFVNDVGAAAPTTKPAAFVYETPVNLAPGVGARPPAGPADEPLPNMVLLAASPFAVEAPRPRQIRVHDLVTVIIRESRTSINDARLKSEKDWRTQSALARWFKLDDCDLAAQTFPDGVPGIDWDFNNKYEGKGSYDRKDELMTRITARVIDVKPNGNLVLEASKRIENADEVLIATLTGECRAGDITPQNTVLSTQLADLEIRMPDEGAVRDATRRGWLMRLFDFTRPI